MEVFIGWSGDRSKHIAEALHTWLPSVIQALRPWMSSEDIAKGTSWSSEISARLENSNAGILCLTRENLESPWLIFEAGALSKSVLQAYVCPYLFDLAPAELKGPLAQFQASVTNEGDTRKLVLTLNKALKNELLPQERIEDCFRVWWPHLQDKLSAIPQAPPERLPSRPDRDILEEILASVRTLSRQTGPALPLEFPSLASGEAWVPSAEPGDNLILRALYRSICRSLPPERSSVEGETNKQPRPRGRIRETEEDSS